MNKSLRNLALASTTVAAASTALATNGDNLIGVGPISRAMGGTGIAAPQDAISAVFANPAATCFTPGCDYAEMNFAGTVFRPVINAGVDMQGMPSIQADSEINVYAIPAIGISVPIDPETRRLRFGLAAYGVTGLGVDYRGTALDTMIPTPFPPPMDQVPLVQGAYTSLMIMKFAPSVAYQVAPNLSVGLAMHIDYATLDLGSGSSPAYGIGAQVGALWRPTEKLSVGITYISPQSTDFKNVVDYTDPFTFQSSYRGLELESPNTVGLGLAYSFLEDRLLATVDGKWLNWSDTAGYGDFGWENQWVVGLGLQFAVVPEKMFVRAGYNYGNNPVEEQNGWGTDPTHTVPVQGMNFPDYYYQTFRVIGFPAVVEHHITAGIGYAFSKKFELHLGYMHAFENTLSESGFAMGAPVTITSTLKEDSLDFGLTWRF